MQELNKKLTNCYTSKKVVAINIGYAQTKIRYGENKSDIVIFNSKVGNYIDESPNNLVEIDGKKYCVSTGNYSFDLNKSNTLHQKVLLRHSLDLIKGEMKNVVVAMPCNVYINKQHRKDYLELVKSMHDVSDAIVYIEGGSLVFHDYDFFKNKVCVLLDIGGFTINGMIFDDCQLIKESVFSVPLGILVLNDRIRTSLEQNSYSMVNDEQIKYMYESDIAKNIVDSYIEEIKNILRKKGYPTFDMCSYRCTGGGSELLREVLVQNFNAYIGDNPVFENVNGMYQVGKEYFS